METVVAGIKSVFSAGSDLLSSVSIGFTSICTSASDVARLEQVTARFAVILARLATHYGTSSAKPNRPIQTSRGGAEATMSLSFKEMQGRRRG